MSKEEEYLEPLERLEKLRESLKGKKSLQAIRSTTSEILRCKPNELKEFNYKVNNHKWRGVVYQVRNSLMGTVVSLWDNKEIILLRGYPKVRYALDSRVKDRECTVQLKYDGTNLGLFLLPDGTLWGKTRLTAHFDQASFKDKTLSWKELLGQVRNGSTLRRIRRLLKEKNYIVYGELYGYRNPGDFIKYSVPIDFKVFDIVDRNTMRFLSPKEVYDICWYYGIPRVETIWSGILTNKEIERLEFEAKNYLKKDGAEGFVAKAVIGKDVYMCKLKSEETKEKAWSLTGKRPLISTLIIRKAIRKTLENFPDKTTINEIYPVVYEELKEEVKEDLIKESEKKIKKEIQKYLTSSDEELLKKVIEELKELEKKGVNIEDKDEVLKLLSKKFQEIEGKVLFRVFNQALRKETRDE